MIRIYSIQQALELRGTIPELAVIRAIQFMGDGYSPEEHGHIIVIQEGGDITHIKEIGEVFIDDMPVFEYVEAFVAGDQVTFELVFQIDDERAIAVIADAAFLDDDLRELLFEYSPPPQPLPTIEKEVMP